MSISIAVHVGRYILTASDTREMLYDRDLIAILEVRGGRSKVRTTPYGLITGTGSVPLLEAVMNRAPGAADSQALLAMIADERRKVEVDNRKPEETRRHILDTTGWMLTCPGAGDTVRLFCYHPMRFRLYWEGYPDRTGHALWPIGPGNGTIWLPETPGEEHLLEQVTDDLFARLQAGLQVCQTGEPLKPSITHHWHLVQSVLAEAAERLPTCINPHCHIGIHTDEGTVDVCEVDVWADAAARDAESEAVPVSLCGSRD